MNNTSPIDRFIKFIHLREEMREHKTFVGGDGPHSDDPLLAHYSFCNINREHDAVTRFIHERFRIPFYRRGKTFMVRQMLFCRIFNEPDVLRLVCPLEHVPTASKILREYRNTGKKLMRGAYMMPPHGKGAGEGDIVDHWLGDVLEPATGRPEFPLHPLNYEDVSLLSRVAEMLMSVCGIGPFIANQVCTDLRYVPEWGCDWVDWDTFILCGPGTRRGMNRYFGRKLDFPGNDESFSTQLLQIRVQIDPRISPTIRGYYEDPNNLSNSFCEFDKWERGHEALAAGKEVTLRHYKPKTNQLDLFS